MLPRRRPCQGTRPGAGRTATPAHGTHTATSCWRPPPDHCAAERRGSGGRSPRPPEMEWPPRDGAPGRRRLRPALAFGHHLQDGASGSVLALIQPLRGAALVDFGRVADGLDELQLAHTDGGTSRAAATSALIALLEHPRAALPGRQEVARTVLGWAEHGLGHTGEVALMRAQRRGLSSRTGTSDRILRPGPRLRTAGHRRHQVDRWVSRPMRTPRIAAGSGGRRREP